MDDNAFKRGEFQGRVIQELLEIKELLTKKVDRAEFIPVKSIVYGLVGIILMGVVGAIVAGVVKATTFIID